MPLDHMILALGTGCVAALLVVSIVLYFKTKHLGWIVVIALLAILAGVGVFTLVDGRSVGDPRYEDEPIAITSAIPETTKPAPKLEVEESTDKDEDAKPIHSQDVSHVFVAELLGLESGASHSFYVLDSADDLIEKNVNDEKYGYFLTTKERHRIGSEIGKTSFTYVDVLGDTHEFTIDNERIDYLTSRGQSPKLSAYIEASTDEESGLYGTTEFWKPGDAGRVEDDECNLQISKKDSSKLTCTWDNFGQVAKTSIDKDSFERGLTHVLNNGVGYLKIQLSKDLHDEIVTKESE